MQEPYAWVPSRAPALPRSPQSARRFQGVLAIILFRVATGITASQAPRRPTHNSASHTPSRPPLHRLGPHSPASSLSLARSARRRARAYATRRRRSFAEMAATQSEQEATGCFPADMRRAPSVLAAAHYSPVIIVLLLSVTSQGYKENTRADRTLCGILFSSPPR